MALSRTGEWIGMVLDGELDAFNARAARERPDLHDADLRGADLRAVDLSEVDLDGASINEARISGALFPRDLPAEEISLPVWKGTRMRARRG